MGFFDMFRSKEKARAEMVGKAWAEILVENELNATNSTLRATSTQISNYQYVSYTCQRIIALELFYLRIFSVDYALHGNLGSASTRNRIMNALRTIISERLAQMTTIINDNYFDSELFDSIQELKRAGVLQTPLSVTEMCFRDELNQRMSSYANVVTSSSDSENMCVAISIEFLEAILKKTTHLE